MRSPLLNVNLPDLKEEPSGRKQPSKITMQCEKNVLMEVIGTYWSYWSKICLQRKGKAKATLCTG